MIAKYNQRSLLLGAPGLGLQLFGIFSVPIFGEQSAIRVIIILAGTILLLFGLGYYAKAKGHSVLWGVLGFLGLIGLIVLALLSDRTLPDRH